jgi:hypothetical protein
LAMKYKRKQRVDGGRLLSVRIHIESQVTEPKLQSQSYRDSFRVEVSEPVGSRDQSQRKMAPPKEATTSTSVPKKPHRSTNNVTYSRRDTGGIILSINIPQGLYPTKKSIHKIGQFTEGCKVSTHGATDSRRSDCGRGHVRSDTHFKVCQP